MHELGVLLGLPFLSSSNRVRVLLNGDEIFPPILAAIRNATASITFETVWSKIKTDLSHGGVMIETQHPTEPDALRPKPRPVCRTFPWLRRCATRILIVPPKQDRRAAFTERSW